MVGNTKDVSKTEQVKLPFFYNINFIAFFFLSIFILVLNNSKITENDTWWHLRLGKWMVENEKFLRVELFNKLVEGSPYIAYEWLSQVAFYLMEDVNGFYLSIFKMLGMIFASMGLAWFFTRESWKGALSFPILIVFMYFMAFRAQLRPHLFGMWFTAFLIVGIWSWRENFNIKKLWWLIPMQVLWANAHGSFLLGPCIFLFLGGVVFFCQQFPIFPGDQINIFPRKVVKHLLALSGVLFAVSLVNPYGYLLFEKYLSMFSSHNYMRDHIREWKSITSVSVGYFVILWFAWISFGWFLIIKNRKTISFFDISILLLATIFPFLGIRYLTLSAMLSLPIMLKLSFNLFPTGFRPKVMIITLLPCVVYVGIYGYPLGLGANRVTGVGFNFSQVPLAIVQHMKSHKLKGVMMNHYNDGSYIVYYGYPDVKTVMDSRTDIYSLQLFEEQHEAFLDYDLFKNYIKKYDINLVMNRTSRKVLRNFLYDDPDWKLEKVGLNYDLFSKRSKVQSLSPSEIKVPSILDIKTRYCIFVRLYGYCFKSPECKQECEYTNEDIAQVLGLSDLTCLFFTQACLDKKFSCNNCKQLCHHHNMVLPKLNKELPIDFSSVTECN